MSSDQHTMTRHNHCGGHDGHGEAPFKRSRTAAGLECGRQTSLETQGGPFVANSEEADELGGKGSRLGRSVLSHVATEQRRRDKINEGFLALRELIPHKDKMDKATFLQQAVEYIRQLQAVMHQLLSMGAVNGLPEDIQWAIRMLLPRKEDVQASAETAVKPAEAALSQLVPSTAYLPYLLQPQQLAVLTQHAQQAKQPAVTEAAKPAPPAPAPTVDLNQLQALMQQQQAAQQLQAQQAARAGMWPDQTALWQLAQLQQMMQGAGQPVPQMPQCSMGGLNQETLNTLAQAHALQSVFSHAPNGGTAALPVPGQALAPAPVASVPSGVGESCAAPPQFCSGSVPLPAGPPKARKSSAKLRKHTSAAKIAKPEAVRPPAQTPGRPDAMSMMQI